MELAFSHSSAITSFNLQPKNVATFLKDWVRSLQKCGPANIWGVADYGFKGHQQQHGTDCLRANVSGASVFKPNLGESPQQRTSRRFKQFFKVFFLMDLFQLIFSKLECRNLTRRNGDISPTEPLSQITLLNRILHQVFWDARREVLFVENKT